MCMAGRLISRFHSLWVNHNTDSRQLGVSNSLILHLTDNHSRIPNLMDSLKQIQYLMGSHSLTLNLTDNPNQTRSPMDGLNLTLNPMDSPSKTHSPMDNPNNFSYNHNLNPIPNPLNNTNSSPLHNNQLS